VDICHFQQFAADGVEAGPSECANSQAFHVSPIDSHEAPDDRYASDKAQRSCRSGDDEDRDGMLDIIDFNRDLIVGPHLIYAISVSSAIESRVHFRHAGGASPNLKETTIFHGIQPGSKETSMLARDEDILKAAEDWRREGRGVALATVVETWGSAPRPVGSNLVIDTDGNFLGSVSGGCVEGAVVTEALDVIDSGKSKMLEFGVADETAWKVGLSCGGTIRVYVEKVE
jgi:XdhC and CoxI family